MDNKSKTVSFKLERVTTEQFATIHECFNEKETVNLQASLRFATNDENRVIGVFAEFRFTCQQNVFMMIEAGCHFQIQPTSWDEMVSNSTLTIPKGLMQHLAVITVGTVRGILHAKTEGTQFNKFVLPTINVTELVKQDVSFSLQKE